jgi:hypothetical protein
MQNRLVVGEVALVGLAVLAVKVVGGGVATLVQSQQEPAYMVCRCN